LPAKAREKGEKGEKRKTETRSSFPYLSRVWRADFLALKQIRQESGVDG
jgi:hypothetical protein